MPHVIDISGPDAGAGNSPYVRLNEQPGNAIYYDNVMYEPGGYDAHIWAMERSFVEARAPAIRPAGELRYLDFACGTGRVLQAIAPHAVRACGVDMSHEMLRHAAAKCPDAEFVRADIRTDADALGGPFDLITAFRFFLNTEDDMRLPVLRSLVGLLAGPDARLVFNIHMNARSSLLIADAYMRLRGWGGMRMMTLPHIRALIDDAGLRIVEMRGYGMFPRGVYRSPLRGAAKRLDRFLARQRLLGPYSHDLVFVCARALP